ncbi:MULTISPECIES: hypothetical protein [Micrococcaceae]|uniref:hypothetical protein n=1 Tax=Micrococcaceae TaxID=1268 RepID=UPI000BB693C8|nr:hypothetical protein [Glutamicibacter sp. BW78]PCC25176.1 hypothetical protein CIK75_09160 [Glutamicibacter sp. BW78]
MDPDHHLSATEARESLEALDAVGDLNAERLHRPRRYWPMVGALLAVLALVPLATDLLPPLVVFLLMPGMIVVIFSVAARKQPPAVRHIRLQGSMWLPYLGGVLVIGVVGGLNAALYDLHGWWWSPVIAAVGMFLFCAVGGPALDRCWIGRARSRRD